MASLKRIVKQAGGPIALAREMGPPVSEFQIRVWMRNGDVPEAYRGRLAAVTGVKESDLQPEVSPKGEYIRHRIVARLYGLMLRYASLKPDRAAKLHGVEEDTVQRWAVGFDEAPEQAFIDLYRFVSGKPTDESSISVEDALRLTGLTRPRLMELLDVPRSTMSRWAQQGFLPPLQGKKVMEIVRKHEAVRESKRRHRRTPIRGGRYRGQRAVDNPGDECLEESKLASE